MSPRYAIYAAPGLPPASIVGITLREAAERWIGRSVTGSPVTPAVPAGWTRPDIDAVTVDARRYGFHATLKAPFRLADGRTAEELRAAVARFAASRAGTVIPRLTLARLGGFLALVPGAPATELHTLAADVVTGFDQFRAPATEAEIARRRPESLSRRQRELLSAWGYPYVLDEFRFHMTLTDSVPEDRRPPLERTLTAWFDGLLGADVPVDALALFTEAEPGAPFTLHSAHPLLPVPAPSPAVAADSAAAPEGTR